MLNTVHIFNLGGWVGGFLGWPGLTMTLTSCYFIFIPCPLLVKILGPVLNLWENDYPVMYPRVMWMCFDSTFLRRQDAISSASESPESPWLKW